jgi:hypothetical protein
MAPGRKALQQGKTVSFKKQELVGSFVIVSRPEQLRAPNDKKVIGRVGKVEFAQTPKAGSRADSIAQVRFPSIKEGLRPSREFTVAVHIDNLQVVPEGYNPSSHATVPAPGRSDSGVGWQRLAEVEQERDTARRDAADMRNQLDALRAQLDMVNLHRQGNITLWRGDGTDQIESLDPNMAVLIRVDQLAEINSRATSCDEGAASKIGIGIVPTSVEAMDEESADRISLQRIAGLLAGKYRDAADDFTLSIGHWEPDPLMPPLEQFCAYLSVPMSDWRAYAGDAIKLPLIEAGMTVRVKDPSKFSVAFSRKVRDREGEVIWVGGTESNPRPGEANIRFDKRNGLGKRFDEILKVRDLEIVSAKPASTIQHTPDGEAP